MYIARHWGFMWTSYQCIVASLRFHRQTMRLVSHTYHYVAAVNFSCFFTTNNVRDMELHLRCSISFAATLHIKLKLDLRWARQKRHRPHTWAGKHGLAIPWKILATARPVKLVSRYIHTRLRISAITCSSFISFSCKQNIVLPFFVTLILLQLHKLAPCSQEMCSWDHYK